MSKLAMERYFNDMNRAGKFKKESTFFAKKELKASKYREEILRKLTNAFNKTGLHISKDSLINSTVSFLIKEGDDYIDLAHRAFLNPIHLSPSELNKMAKGEKIGKPIKRKFIESEPRDLPLTMANPGWRHGTQAKDDPFEEMFE